MVLQLHARNYKTWSILALFAICLSGTALAEAYIAHHMHDTLIAYTSLCTAVTLWATAGVCNIVAHRIKRMEQ